MQKYITILLFAVLFSCTGKPLTEEVHDHSEEESFNATFYSPGIEFYMEYAPVHGKESWDFLVHVTLLDEYSPATKGKLKLRIEDREPIEGSLLREGIFTFEELILGQGHQQLLFTYIENEEGRMEEASVHLDIPEEPHREGESAHNHEDDGEDHEHGDEELDHSMEEHAHNGADLTFTKEQAWNSKFMVEKAETGPFYSIVAASGQIQAVPGKKAHIPAKAGGILKYSQKNLVQGAYVLKGEALFTISDESLAEDNFELRYRELESELEKSRKAYHRQEALYAQQIIPEKEFEITRTGYIRDSLRFYSLARESGKNGILIYSPITGYIHELNFHDGQYVAMGEQLVTISSNKTLLLQVDVPMQFFPDLENLETAHFRTAYSEKIYRVKDLNGTLLSKGSSVAENNHFIPVFFEVENDGSLLEGAFIECFLLSASNKSVISLPASAIMEEYGGHYVYVQESGESYYKQSVTPGAFDGLHYEILGGITDGERVVTEGAMLIKAASMIVGEGGHNHSH